MEWVAIVGTAISILGMLGTISGVVFALGKRDARLCVLEDRLKEDREKNSEQHKEFYGMKDTVTSILARFDGLERRLQLVEEGITEILRRIPNGSGK